MATQGIPVIEPLLNLIIGSRNERFVKKYTQRVDAINKREPEIRGLSDEEIRAKVLEFRERFDKGEKADALMVDAFAIAREAMDRNVGIRNILNPEKRHLFDADRLPDEARRLYDQCLREAESLPVIIPETFQGEAPEDAQPDEEGRFLGSGEAIHGWQYVDIPPALYEAVRELYPESRPPFRARPFDVQLIGAMVLYQGKISEMKTGEGKTIVAPLAAYLAAVERWKVHVVTVNDYLVQRDRDWTFPFFRSLGLTVGAIHPQHLQDEDIKRGMYRCDVVYGTTSEFGFDYLRDNMKRSVDQQVQRRREYAIVDEVDSILIDEARTPLIISGQAHEDQPRYEMADQIARHLVAKQAPWQEWEDKANECKKRIKGLEGDIRNARDKGKVPELQRKLGEARAELPKLESQRDQYTQYYEIKEDRKQCHLTHEGVAEAQRKAGVGSFYVDENMDIPHLLEQSLRAHVVYQRDKDYVVMDVPDRSSGKVEPSIVIVDSFTGRPMIGRQWSDGLHQAIECKEGVPVKPETQTIATITVQNFFKMYKRLAGMTGTADTEAQEFHDIYSLDVVSIPTNKPVIRRDFDDLMFLSEKDKWDTIVEEIKRFHDVGCPILVGTTSVEKSERLAHMLKSRHGAKHEVLNAKQHEREAQIVKNAGQLGAVMIATNMAGRGTDIVLGELTREQLLEHWLRRGICPRSVTVDSTDEELREAVFRKVASQELGIKKREAEEMPFEELELKLLRHWANEHTWASEKKIEQMGREALMEEIDSTGRVILHRIRWFRDIEDMGGLHVVGTERHEARRIDNQLRGRSGRQGDKGSSRFFVSLEDDLMRMFAGDTTMKILSRLGMREGDAIEHPMLSKSMERAQRKVEERNFQIRKNILEYDEVMEHQRQTFYGLRQRVLEGRDVKGLILEYIEESVMDACDEFLDRDYPAQCAAEHAKNVLDCSVLPERLRNRERSEMEDVIRKEAKEDAEHNIDITLGEYMPIEESEVSVDFDSAGLVNWAKSRFGVDIDSAELREGGRSEREQVKQKLIAAAAQRIDEADLSGIDEYLAPDYGTRKLAEWFQEKFGIEADAEELISAEKDDDEARNAANVLISKARESYNKREVEYPVEFAMELTVVLMQRDPASAAEQLANWARRRFELDWTADTVKSKPPQQIREQLLAESRKFHESGRIERDIEQALKCETDEELEQFFRQRYDVGLPHWMRWHKSEEDRRDAIRGRVESVLRAELLQFEQVVLLDTLDAAWKDHLYEMDQLREAIGFRAFSQRDPRIEYKREGSRLLNQMMDTIRDRLTDYIFKVRISPLQMAAAQGRAAGGRAPGQRRPAAGATPGQRQAPGRVPAAPATAAGRRAAAGQIASTITGPGFSPGPPSPPPVPSTPAADPNGGPEPEPATRGRDGAGPDGPSGEPAADEERSKRRTR